MLSKKCVHRHKYSKWNLCTYIFFIFLYIFCWFVAMHCLFSRSVCVNNGNKYRRHEAGRLMIFNCRPCPSPLVLKMLSANSTDINAVCRIWHTIVEWECGALPSMGVAHALNKMEYDVGWEMMDCYTHTHTKSNTKQKKNHNTIVRLDCIAVHRME